MANATERKLDPRLLPFIDAYVEAIFNKDRHPLRTAGKITNTNHHGVMQRPGVYEEITTRISNYLSLADIDKVRVLNEFKKAAFSSLADVVDLKDGNISVKDFSKIDKDALDSIQSLKYDKHGNVEISMYSKTDSLKELANILNMKKTTIDVNHGVQKPGLFDNLDLSELDDDELIDPLDADTATDIITEFIPETLEASNDTN